jgi:hypothetical protein
VGRPASGGAAWPSDGAEGAGGGAGRALFLIGAGQVAGRGRGCALEVTAVDSLDASAFRQLAHSGYFDAYLRECLGRVGRGLGVERRGERREYCAFGCGEQHGISA